MPRSRNSFAHKLSRALADPASVRRYTRRLRRNRKLAKAAGSHSEFYRGVMADDVQRRSAIGAVGTERMERWQAVGRKQFRFLKGNGLRRDHRLLEIGCGNLRAGRHFIRYLRPGNYTGVDISPDILLAAQDTIVEYELQDQAPALFLVTGTNLDFLPARSFDVVHAHSVFTHTPLDVVTAYFAAVHRVLRPGGFFDFTYHHSEGEAWHFLREDFYYPTGLLLDLATAAGFTPRVVEEWTYPQPKLRLIRHLE